MIIQRLRKTGNSLAVTIPREEVERQGLTEGEFVAIDVRRVTVRPEISGELAAYVEELSRDEQMTAALQYLKNH